MASITLPEEIHSRIQQHRNAGRSTAADMESWKSYAVWCVPRTTPDNGGDDGSLQPDLAHPCVCQAVSWRVHDGDADRLYKEDAFCAWSQLFRAWITMEQVKDAAKPDDDTKDAEDTPEVDETPTERWRQLWQVFTSALARFSRATTTEKKGKPAQTKPTPFVVQGAVLDEHHISTRTLTVTLDRPVGRVLRPTGLRSVQALHRRCPNAKAMNLEEVVTEIITTIQSQVIGLNQMLQIVMYNKEEWMDLDAFTGIIQSADVHMIRLLTGSRWCIQRDPPSSFLDAQHQIPDEMIQYALYLIRCSCAIGLYLCTLMNDKAEPERYLTSGHAQDEASNLWSNKEQQDPMHRFFCLTTWITRVLEMYMLLPPGSAQRDLIKNPHSTVYIDADTIRSFQTTVQHHDSRIAELLNSVKALCRDDDVVHHVRSWLHRQRYDENAYISDMIHNKRRKHE